MALVACALGLACGGAGPGSVRSQGAERFVDIGGGLELGLAPSTDARHVRSEVRDGLRVITFHEAVAGGGWAEIQVRRREIDAAAADRMEAEPQRLYQLLGASGEDFRPAPAPVPGVRAWVSEMGLVEGEHHEPLRDGGPGHATVWDPPRYQWSAAFAAAGAAVALSYVAAVQGGGDESLTAEQILARGQASHRAAADALYARLRLRPAD